MRVAPLSAESSPKFVQELLLLGHASVVITLDTYSHMMPGPVTGFNSFQYAANPANSLEKTRRVARAGAVVVVATRGNPEDCEAAAYLAALGSLLPPPPPGAPGPFALSGDGALEALVAGAGLTPTAKGEVDVPWTYPDLEIALKGLMSAGPAVKAVCNSDEDRVRDAIAHAIAPFRTASGSYRVENKFRYLIARA